MGYYIRILGLGDPDIPLEEIEASLEKSGLKGHVFIDDSETSDKWSFLQIVNKNGEDLAQVERNPVIDGELGKEELEEFRYLIAGCKPTSAAKWLDQYFDRVKVIYAFQLLSSTFENENYSIVNAVRDKIWNKTGGILQADSEGFSNEEGYHILWQFSDKVAGEWHCAVLNEVGEWQSFRMDLGDPAQRREFQSGKVPSA